MQSMHQQPVFFSYPPTPKTLHHLTSPPSASLPHTHTRKSTRTQKSCSYFMYISTKKHTLTQFYPPKILSNMFFSGRKPYTRIPTPPNRPYYSRYWCVLAGSGTLLIESLPKLSLSSTKLTAHLAEHLHTHIKTSHRFKKGGGGRVNNSGWPNCGLTTIQRRNSQYLFEENGGNVE